MKLGLSIGMKNVNEDVNRKPAEVRGESEKMFPHCPTTKIEISEMTQDVTEIHAGPRIET